MKFCFELGDPSADGHGISEKIFVESNVELDILEKAYEDSCKKTGINFKDICSDYEDNTLPYEVQRKFIELGCPMKEIFEWDDEEAEEILESEEDDIYLDEEPFVKLLMWFIGLSIPDGLGFKWKIVEDTVPRFSKSFGYGLYSN